MILDVVCKKGKKLLEPKLIQFGVISVGIYYHGATSVDVMEHLYEITIT